MVLIGGVTASLPLGAHADLEWHELGDQSHLFPLMFLSGPDGDITALTVPFEPAAGPWTAVAR